MITPFLKSESSGHFKRLLYSLSTGMRDESGDVNVSVATADAAELKEAGIDTIGTDESVFNRSVYPIVMMITAHVS